MAKQESQEPREIPGTTRPFNFTEAAMEAQRLVNEQVAKGQAPSPVPVSFQDLSWPSPDHKGQIYWDVASNQHIVSAYDRSNVKPGSTFSTGLTGGAEITNPPLTPPENSQN